MSLDRAATLGAWSTEPRYRTIGEDRIVDLLLASGWAAEIAGGGAAPWRHEAEAVLERLVVFGLPVLCHAGERRFDPVEVVNCAKAAGLAGLDGFWLDRCVASERARYLAYTPGSLEGQSSDAAQVSVILNRNFNIAGTADRSARRLRLPLPIVDRDLWALSVEIVEPCELDWQVLPDLQRIEATSDRSRGPVSVTVRFDFTCGPGGPDAPDEDVRPYLRRSEGLIQVTPGVEVLASRLAEGLSSPRAKISRFRDLLLDHLICGPVHHDQAPSDLAVTDWVLETGRFDCHVGSAFLAALCRAEQIPARIVTGHTLHPELSVYHSWVEIFLDGRWTPYDLFAWDLSAAGRDPAWREAFAGMLEPRMKTQSLPSRFTGQVGVPWPRRWHMLTRRVGRSTETSFVDIDTGALVYSDTVEVTVHRPRQPTGMLEPRPGSAPG